MFLFKVSRTFARSSGQFYFIGAHTIKWSCPSFFNLIRNQAAFRDCAVLESVRTQTGSSCCIFLVLRPNELPIWLCGIECGHELGHLTDADYFIIATQDRQYVWKQSGTEPDLAVELAFRQEQHSNCDGILSFCQRECIDRFLPETGGPTASRSATGSWLSCDLSKKYVSKISQSCRADTVDLSELCSRCRTLLCHQVK